MTLELAAFRGWLEERRVLGLALLELHELRTLARDVVRREDDLLELLGRGAHDVVELQEWADAYHRHDVALERLRERLLRA